MMAEARTDAVSVARRVTANPAIVFSLLLANLVIAASLAVGFVQLQTAQSNSRAEQAKLVADANTQAINESKVYTSSILCGIIQPYAFTIRTTPAPPNSTSSAEALRKSFLDADSKLVGCTSDPNDGK